MRGGHSRVSRRLDRIMTIATINTELRDMMFVAEWNRLFDGPVDVGIIRRPGDDVSGVTEASEKKRECDQPNPKPGVRSRRENLGHCKLRGQGGTRNGGPMCKGTCPSRSRLLLTSHLTKSVDVTGRAQCASLVQPKRRRSRHACLLERKIALLGSICGGIFLVAVLNHGQVDR